MLEPMTTYLETRPEVIAAYLYGSYATGRQKQQSDVDIAIHTLPFENRLESFNARVRYQKDISDILKKDVDIVLLQEIGEALLYQILKNGRLFFERNRNIHRAFVARKMIQCLDFQFLQKRMQKGMITAMRREAGGQ